MKIILIAATATLLLSSCVSSMVTSNNPVQESSAVASIASPVIEKQSIALSEVPTMVLASLNRTYPKNIIQTISRVTVDEKVYYKFVISNNKRKKFPVVFNENAAEEKNSNLK